MELKNVICDRRSIRKYKDVPVPSDSIYEIIEAARLAPSGANSQPWRFVVIRSAEKRKALREGTVRFVADAPIVLACCVDINAYRNLDELSQKMYAQGVFDGVDISTKVYDDYVNTERPLEENVLRSYCLFNSAFAIENLVLRAHDLGLGTCIIAMFNQKVVHDLLDLPPNIVISALIAVGYPAEAPQQRQRLPLEEIIIKEV